MLALIHLNPAHSSSASSSSSSYGTLNSSGRYSSPSTLVIVPTSLVGQWMTELTKHSTTPLRVYAWYGPGRIKDPVKLSSQYDVILTTFGIVESESRNNGDLLQSIDWHRIIVDESHHLRNRATRQTRNIIHLHAARRWLLTGTPISHSIDDIFSQFQFFHMPILSSDHRLASATKYHVFRQSVNIQERNAMDSYPFTPRLCHATVIRMFTRSIMRHKKNQTFNQRPQLIILPPKHMVRHKLTNQDNG